MVYLKSHTGNEVTAGNASSTRLGGALLAPTRGRPRWLAGILLKERLRQTPHVTSLIHLILLTVLQTGVPAIALDR